MLMSKKVSNNLRIFLKFILAYCVEIVVISNLLFKARLKRRNNKLLRRRLRTFVKIFVSLCRSFVTEFI